MALIQRKAQVKYYDQDTGDLLDTSITTYQAFACDVCGKWEQSREIPDNWYLVRCVANFQRNELEEAHICSGACLYDYARGKVEAKVEVAA